jgi:hypothetical protein
MPADRGDTGSALLADAAQVSRDSGNGQGWAGLQILADMSVNLSRAVKAIEDQVARNQRLWSQIRPIPGIPVGQLTAASATLAQPELAGPRSGYWWDVHLINGATFTGGAVNVYRSAGGTTQPDINLVGGFPSAGYLTYGKAQLLLAPGQYLIFGSSSAFTGTANISLGSVTEIAATALPDYLL